MSAAAAASSCTQSRMARSKQPDILLDKSHEQAAVDFMNQVLGDIDPPIECGKLHEMLKDGVLLCNLVNKLRPGTIKHVGQRNLTFIKMDNITRFLQGARQLGLSDSQLFETSDLFEAKDIPAVIHTIMAIAQMYSNEKKEEHSKEEDDEDDDEQSAGSPQEKEQEQVEEPTIMDIATTTTTVDNDVSNDPCSGHRDVRDIFSISTTFPDTTTTLNHNPALARPPKSPLRPASSKRRPRRKSIDTSATDEDRWPTCSRPTFATQGRQSDYVALSRTSSTSSCNSFMSSPNGSPKATRRQSVNFPQQHHHQNQYHQHSPPPRPQSQHIKAESLGRKLDRNLAKSVEEGRSAEKLLLKSKDGMTRAQYQLGNCIGKGQFGAVYRALDLGTGETVAVKRIKLHDAEDQDDIMKEATLLKTLSHCNVIQYLGFIPSRNHINIILEYAEGGSLMSTLKAFGAFPEKLVASFCMKILNGLEYLHANEVVHCDLKAANILTTKTGDVKLSDFGVSLNLKKTKVDANDVSGTPNWMAPEVIELKGASSKSDIWSLGCTLIELITGKPPYADLIAMSAMFRIVEDDHPPLPDVSEPMHDFLLSCFQKHPQDRPSATELLDHPWLQMHSAVAGASRPTSMLQHHQQNRSMSSRPASMVAQQQQQPISSSSEPTKENTLPSGARQQRQQGGGSRPSSVVHPLENRPLSENILMDPITHRFIKMSFGKVVECKVCGDLMKSQAIFCEVCALICHDNCKKLAFSCPPKVNDQQPSYDWVFSAKIYNNNGDRRSASMPTDSSRPSDHPQFESIRKYSVALGLTPREEQALCENQALLTHTLAMQHDNPAAVANLLNKKQTKDRKKSLRGTWANLF